MKIAATVATIIICVAYAILMHVDPTWGLLRPRGGLLTLSISLLLANAAIWASRRESADLKSRVEFAVAGWLWLLVQAGALFYFLIANANPV